MDVEFVIGEPGGEVEVVARFAVDTPPPLAAGDRVLIGDARRVLIDADWTVGTLGQQGFQAVRFYLDKATDATGNR